MILVVGGTGFIGAGIVRELSRRGKNIAVLSRDPIGARARFAGLEIDCRRGDVRDAGSLAPSMQGVDVVIACQQFPKAPIEDKRRRYTYDEVDGRGTENLVQAAKATDVKRVIYLSGSGAAPDSGYHWFRAKWRAETAVRDSGITYVIFRPSWVYGPEDVSLNRFLGMSRFLPFVPMIGATGRQRLQPVFVDDVSRAVVESVGQPAADNHIFDIGGPEVLTMNEIVRTALEVSGRRRLLLPAPKSVMKLAAYVLQFLPGRPLTPDAVDFITMDALADPADMERALGVKMTPLREALSIYMGVPARQ